jgi:hypothetical protein
MSHSSSQPPPDLSDSDPVSLSNLMDEQSMDAPAWNADELAAILRHQMSAPIGVDLENLGAPAADRMRTLSDANGLLLKSFAELLHHPNPPIPLLQLTKDFAKAHRSHPDSPLPREVANVLYYATVIVARLRCGRRISRLDDHALLQGMRWTLSQNWLDPATRSLFAEALPKIAPGKEGQQS